MKSAQSTDFNPITIFECGRHLIEKFGYNPGCFNISKTVCFAEGLDEVFFVHGDPFFGKCSNMVGLDHKYWKYLQQCDRICQTRVVICVKINKRGR